MTIEARVAAVENAVSDIVESYEKHLKAHHGITYSVRCAQCIYGCMAPADQIDGTCGHPDPRKNAGEIGGNGGCVHGIRPSQDDALRMVEDGWKRERELKSKLAAVEITHNAAKQLLRTAADHLNETGEDCCTRVAEPIDTFLKENP